MASHHGETTDGALLERLGDWADHLAWLEFVERYDPMVRRHCRAFRFDADTLEELCQRIWIELARHLRTYRYDPGKRFRGWLRRLCRSRAIDLWRQRQTDPLRRIVEEGRLENLEALDLLDSDDADESERPALLRQAEHVQQAVRGRVDDQTWRTFWSVTVEGGSVSEAAEAAGISYAAAFAAQKRVRRMLREEAERLTFEANS
ncbi:MAG: sigma-70 family RNA polymerase sigma factor [Isosphaeraceae bacterium]